MLTLLSALPLFVLALALAWRLHEASPAAGAFVVLAGLACILFAAGVAFAGVAAHYAVVMPLGRLAAAVEAWRRNDGWSRTHDARDPTEVAALSDSFAAAVAALDAQREALRRAAEQQELLMQEIHHRVKNNLQVVASLLNLQASRIRQPQAQAEFQSARDRVRALATLHRHLYAHGEVHTIDMGEFLIELCGQVFQAMGETAGERIGLDIEATPLQMSSDQAVPLALIVTEAVSNSVKYAFPNRRPGKVSVRLLKSETSLRLTIEDDGVGIPAGKVETESGTRDGIGIQLIRGFAKQLGAQLKVEEEHGTRYRVDMPLSFGRTPSPVLGQKAREVPA